LTAAVEVDEEYRQYIQSRPSKSLLSSSSSSSSSSFKLTSRRVRRIQYAS
jgi:hypothetical protein